MPDQWWANDKPAAAADTSGNFWANDQPAPKRSALGEIANQGYAGAVSDLPRMVGKAAQYMSDPGQPTYEWGKGVADAAEARGQAPELQASPDGHGTAVNALASGARMIPSVLPALAGGAAITAATGGGAIPLAAGAVMGAVPFALSAGQETLDKAKTAGVDDQTALDAARKNALITGAGATVGNYLGEGLVGLAGKTVFQGAKSLLAKPATTAAADALTSATSGSVLAPWGAHLAENAIGQTGVMAAQNAATTAVENQAGISKESPLDSAQSAIAPTLGMTALLAPFGLVGHSVRAKGNELRAKTLTDGAADPQQRAQAALQIQSQLMSVDPSAAQAFGQHASAAISAKANLPIGDHLFTAPESGQYAGTTPPSLGYNPSAGTHTVFPDGSVVLNSDASQGAQTVRNMQNASRLAEANKPYSSENWIDELWQHSEQQQEDSDYYHHQLPYLVGQVDNFMSSGGWDKVRGRYESFSPETAAKAKAIDDAYATMSAPADKATPQQRADAVGEIHTALDDEISDFNSDASDGTATPPAAPDQTVPNGTSAAPDIQPMAENSPQPIKPSVAMGLDPAAGPMSAAAALAVDSGAHQAKLDRQTQDQLAKTSQPGDILDPASNRPFPSIFAANREARRLTAQTGVEHAPVDLGSRQFIIRADAAADRPGGDIPAPEAPTERVDVASRTSPDNLEASTSSIADATGAAALQAQAAPTMTPEATREPTTSTNNPTLASPGAEVSRFNGRYDKGMGVNAAELEAKRLNQEAAGAGRQITYSAEEHGDPGLENPYAVAGREAGQAKPATIIDEVAHQAATSPFNHLSQPSEEQKKAGNYQKGHVSLNGLDLSIENPVGSVRSGNDSNGAAWSNTLQDHYGYIKGTIGNDKEHIDVFVKPGTALDYSGPVFVVDQVHPGTGAFDEHKVIIGAKNGMEARQTYQANYAKGWKGLKSITRMPFDEFKAWAKDGPKNEPVQPITETTSTPKKGNPRESQANETQPQQTQPEASATPVAGAASEVTAHPPPSAPENLEAMGLLRFFGGRWQYKISLKDRWWTSNDQASAVEMAQKAFDATPLAERLTTAERHAAYDAARDAENAKWYDNKTDAELRIMLAKLEKDLAQHQKNAKREFNANGYRHTGPAVSAEAARDIGEQKMRLSGYMQRRGIDITDIKPTRVVAATAQADPAPAGPGHLGRNNQPLSEGGKPFKTRLAATEAKKLQPMMRVTAVDGGYALTPKSEKQLAAEAKAARRLRNPQTSPPGEPIPAHAFIASEGGLRPNARPDMNVDGNPRIGNRSLFAGIGKGISMEHATERLTEEGYLGEGASQNDAMVLIKRSLTDPQYTADGIERIAQAEEASRFDDFLAAQNEREYDPLAPLHDNYTADDMISSSYGEASKELRNEVQALLDMAEAKGIDTDAIQGDAHYATEHGTEHDLLEVTKYALQTALEGSRRDRGEDAGLQGEAGNREGEAQGLKSPTQQDVLDQQERTGNADKLDAKAQIDREAKDQTLTQQTAPEQRRDTSGDMFAQEKAQAEIDKRNEGRAEKADPNQGSMFSRDEKFSDSAKAQATEVVERHIGALTKGWEGAPKVIVAFDMSDPRIPEHVRQQDQEQRSSGAEGAPEGFFYKGTAYLMSSQLKTPADTARVLFHEVLGHAGLRGVFGKSLDPILNQLSMFRRQEVIDKAREYGLHGIDLAGKDIDLKAATDKEVFDSMSAAQKRTAAEEVLAEMAQSRPNIGFVKQAVAAIRTWLRENMPGFKNLAMTDDEIVKSYLLPARGFIERGREQGASTNPDARFSRVTDAIKDKLNERKSEIVGDTGRYTPEMREAFKRVGWDVEKPSLKDRAQGVWKDAGMKLAQGIADQFVPIAKLSKEAYMLMRLSKGASGAFETVINGGQLKLEGGTYNFDPTRRGGLINRMLVPLRGEGQDFLRWVAANRAERLAKDGKENLFTADDIRIFKTLADGQTGFKYTIQNGADKGKITQDRAATYKDSLATFNEFNKNVMDMAEQSGLIDAESRKVWEHEFYVPFYRVADTVDGGVKGMSLKSGMVRQIAFKQLKGGDQKLNQDLLANTLQNWAHLLDASAKNRAAKATLEAAEKAGIAVEASEQTVRSMGKDTKNKDGAVWFMDGGKQRWFLVDDPHVLTAINALQYAGMHNPVMNAMSTFKHAMTMGVTASPFFKVKNLARDSIQAIASGPLSYNPVKNLVDGWKLTDPHSDSYFQLLAGGGTIHFATQYEGSEARRVQASADEAIAKSHLLDNPASLKSFWDKTKGVYSAYAELGNKGEAINRAALYDQLRKQGKSHTEASFEARDLMDFSMGGTFATVRFLTQVVPFMNARIQGLYKLGKAAQTDPKRFSAVLGATTIMSLGLMAAYSEDDDWKKRTDSDRNNNWWFKFGGEAYRIPKPFEVGALATLAERAAELAMNDEETGARFRQQLIAICSDQLSMNPTPQMVKPLLDVFSNQNSFTGAPIESPGMQGLEPDYRFNSGTSMAARGISTAANAVTEGLGLKKSGINGPSPLQADYLMSGYMGWLGSFIPAFADTVLRPATGQPARPTPDYVSLATGHIASDLRDQPSRYIDQMYTQAKLLDEAMNTWKMLLKQGKVEEAGKFYEDHQAELAKHGAADNLTHAASNLNSVSRRIEGSTTMSGEDKRAGLRQMQDARDKIARSLQPI